MGWTETQRVRTGRCCLALPKSLEKVLSGVGCSARLFCSAGAKNDQRRKEYSPFVCSSLLTRAVNKIK
uniref:Uncharacterized protein n=1 Tax=Anguilla anguilla TaxID=7936 RepID=A0A0E9PR21_ANGAN